MALQGWSGLAASPNEPLIARQHDVRDGRPGPHQPRTVVVLLGRKVCRLRGGVGEGHRHDGQRSLEVAAEQAVLGCAGRGWGELATLDLGATWSRTSSLDFRCAYSWFIRVKRLSRSL